MLLPHIGRFDVDARLLVDAVRGRTEHDWCAVGEGVVFVVEDGGHTRKLSAEAAEAARAMHKREGGEDCAIRDGSYPGGGCTHCEEGG